MKKMISVLALLLTLCMISSVALADPFEPKKDGGVKGGTLLIQNATSDPQSWNPDYKGDDNLWPMAQNIYNRLIKLAAGDGIDPDLAESYEFTNDGKDLVFHLHEGVVWHDGVPFTSADVKWTYDTIINDSWAYSTSLSSIDSIECPDDNTVIMHLKAADVTIIAKLAWYGTFILPQHIYEGKDVAETSILESSCVGTGPYKLESYESGVQTTLVKNENFWGDEPQLDKLVFLIIGDEDTAYQAFLNGEADYLYSVPAANTFDLDDDPNYRVVVNLWQNRTYITFNFNDPDFGKVEVRQAVAKAIDRQGIFDRVGGGGQLAEYFISPLQVDYVDTQYKMPDRDLEGAIALLESAGYTKDENGFYLHTTFDLFEDSQFSDIAQIVKANLAEVGIDLTINIMEIGAWMEKVIDNANYSMCMLAGYQGPDVSGVANRVQTGAGTNLALYSNPEVDAALEASNVETDIAKRAEYLSIVQKCMCEDMPMVFLIENGSHYPIRQDIVGTPYDVPELAAVSEMTYAAFSK